MNSPLAIQTKIYAQVSLWGNGVNLDIIKIKIWVKVAVSNTEYHYIFLSGLSLTSHCSDHFDRLLKSISVRLTRVCSSWAEWPIDVSSANSLHKPKHSSALSLTYTRNKRGHQHVNYQLLIYHPSRQLSDFCFLSSY
jgi:hypothetical protein